MKKEENKEGNREEKKKKKESNCLWKTDLKVREWERWQTLYPHTVYSLDIYKTANVYFGKQDVDLFCGQVNLSQLKQTDP